MTSRKTKHDLPTHYSMKGIKNLPEDSIVLLEQIKTIDKSRVRYYIGKASVRQIEEIEEALRISIGMKLQ